MGKPKESFPGYDDAVSDEQLIGLKTSKLFFVEKEMRPGKKIKLHLSKDTTTPPAFVSRQVANLSPLRSTRLDNIFEAFSVHPGSVEAKLIKQTVVKCEKARDQRQDQYCATSLESMVDYATSKLGKRVKPISTRVNGKESTALQEYRVEGVKKLAADNVVVCHQEYYAYAVHYCHKSSKINAYEVSLVGDNNMRGDAISICHEDTASWNPKHVAFQVLSVKPGTVSVCHFLVEDEVAWVAY
ncbi:BURP domain-containing protein [Cynara cardunculus var. scolymus]|uniref:BURP domain-containing protein n=2 Tax=Cynara cardunculus var. scolymus TaxID=59895 RepID=A0A103XIQ7_CYNCS|nr:BURP domain-containing protein [Cynara cardunculus var. scolymus]